MTVTYWRKISVHCLPNSDLRTPWAISRHQRSLWGIPSGARGKEPACQCRRLRFNPWVRKIPWRRHGNPLQYSCLENPTDRGAWSAIVHRVVKSQTRLKWFSTHAYISGYKWFVSCLYFKHILPVCGFLLQFFSGVFEEQIFSILIKSNLSTFLFW